MSSASGKQPRENKQSSETSASRRATLVRRLLGVAALLLTLSGIPLVLYDLFGQQLPAFLKEHCSGTLGVFALLAALVCIYLLRKQRAPLPTENKLEELDSELVSRFADAKIELKWLREEVEFYRSSASRHALLYWMFKVPTLVSAALIPICALLLKSDAWITAVLGALIAICEGLMHIGQFHENWLRSVATREQLEREMYLYAASASVYTAPNIPKKASATLTERVIAIMQHEQSQWLEGHRSRASHGPSVKPAEGNPVPPIVK